MEKKENSKGLKILLFVLIAVVIILLGVLVGMIIDENRKTGDDNYGSSQGQVQNSQNTETNVFKLSEKEFPKVDGATAMLPMVGEITKRVIGYTDDQAQKYLDENTQGKSAKVYGSLINKEKDLIFVSEPSDDILRQAKEKNVEFEMIGIGYDGFVFLVNKDNPVESLTLDQIRAIYKGEITNWKQVGGNDEEIFPYQREENSGSQNLMEKMVMKNEKMAEAKSTDLKIGSMTGLIDAVANGNNSKNAIGYSIYLYAKEQYVKDSVKFLKINGVEASDANIANKTYPLTKVVYAVMRKDEAKDSNARKLVDWLKTEEGQKAVIAGGYVGLNTK